MSRGLPQVLSSHLWATRLVGLPPLQFLVKAVRIMFKRDQWSILIRLAYIFQKWTLDDIILLLAHYRDTCLS